MYTAGSSGSMHVLFTGHTEEAERSGSIAKQRTQQQRRRQYLDILFTVLLTQKTKEHFSQAKAALLLIIFL